MISSVKIFQTAKQAVGASARKRVVCTSPSILSGNKKVLCANGQGNIPLPDNSGNEFCAKCWSKVKNFFKELKPTQYIPQNYDMQKNEQIVNATIDRYISKRKPMKETEIVKLRKQMQTELRKFYLDEAKTIEKILTKNKSEIECINKDYQKALDEITKILSGNLPKEERIKLYMEQKVKVDTQFGNKFYDIIAKEYNMEGIKPKLSFHTKESKLIGGWEAIEGEILINSFNICNSKSLMATLLHEFTHFRQDVDVYKLFGADGFYNMITARSILHSSKLQQDKIRQKALELMVIDKLAHNPLYKQLEIQRHKNHNMKKINKKLAGLQFYENIHYKSGLNNSYEEYSGQICERHAYHNGDYGASLFEKLFPEYARIRKVEKHKV